jgi:hypothetical protein
MISMKQTTLVWHSQSKEIIGRERQPPSLRESFGPSVFTSKATVLAIACSRNDDAILQTISSDQAWLFASTDMSSAGFRFAKQHRVGVVLVNRAVLGTDWKDALQLLLEPAHRSCVVLVTPSMTDHFCQQFIEEGGYGLLTTPLNKSDVIEIVERAWSFWKKSIARPYQY